jgi:DNA-binding LacI/PurR family transcriptional regulator
MRAREKTLNELSETQGKRATLNDVARLAGVSYQTVSRVINHHPSVASATRSKVLYAIKQLDYRPNQVAKMLATGRSHMLQLLTYDLKYNDPLPAMVHWARRLGYAMAVSEFDHNAPASELGETLEMLAARMVDGIILLTPYPIPEYNEIKEFCQGTPIVVVATVLGAAVPSVVYDQGRGVELAVTHLLSLGHRDIAEICGPIAGPEAIHMKEHYHARVRHQVLQARLKAEGIQPGPSAVGDFTIQSGYYAAQELVDSGKPFTSIMVGNDRMALGAIRGLRERGIRVPDDVSIVGFDDMPEAEYFDPPLTTVRQDIDSLARESIEYLTSLIARPTHTVHQRALYPELVVRESTRALSSSTVPFENHARMPHP